MRGQSYLRFRMLARPLVQEKASTRGVDQVMVTNTGKAVGVILDKLQKGQSWGGVIDYLGFKMWDLPLVR